MRGGRRGKDLSASGDPTGSVQTYVRVRTFGWQDRKELVRRDWRCNAGNGKFRVGKEGNHG